MHRIVVSLSLSHVSLFSPLKKTFAEKKNMNSWSKWKRTNAEKKTQSKSKQRKQNHRWKKKCWKKEEINNESGDFVYWDTRKGRYETRKEEKNQWINGQRWKKHTHCLTSLSLSVCVCSKHYLFALSCESLHLWKKTFAEKKNMNNWSKWKSSNAEKKTQSKSKQRKQNQRWKKNAEKKKK